MKVTLLLMIFSFCVFANKYKISGNEVEFIFLKKRLVSINCKKGCEALTKVISKEQLKTFDRESGRNAATAACKYVGGQIVRAKSKLGHKTFFCKFEDNSYIHSGHLLP